MMDDSSQDKSSGFDWKYITWPFAIIGLLGVAFLIFIATTVLSFGRDHGEPVVAVQDNGQEVSLQLGGIRALPGTPYWAVQVREERDVAGSYSKGYSDPIRNVLLLEEATGKSIRLLPTHNQRIESVSYWSKNGPATHEDSPSEMSVTDAVQAAEAPDQPSSAVYYIMTINLEKDGRTRQNLLIGHIATQDNSVVLDGLTQVDETWSLGPDKMAVLARKDGALFYHIIDLANRKVLLSQKLKI